MNNEYKLSRIYNGVEVTVRTNDADLSAQELIEVFREFMLACGFAQTVVDGVEFVPYQSPYLD